METLHNNEADDRHNYMMLGRLENDCKYFLGNGNGHEKHLWADTVEDHIKEMEKLYNNIKIKPDWLSMEDIQKYKTDMYKIKLEQNKDNPDFLTQENISSCKEITLNENTNLFKSFSLFKDFKEIKFIIDKTKVQFECLNSNNEYQYLNDEITVENIHLYYEFMSDEEIKSLDSSNLRDIKTGTPIITTILSGRMIAVREALSIHPAILDNFKKYIFGLNDSVLSQSIFGIKDTLKPVEVYVSEIKDSEDYKNYISNN